jgi:uncharacterized protein with HEPN domain
VRDDRLSIQHVIDCIWCIERYCQGGEESFRESELIQDAVPRNLQTPAESTQRTSDRLKTLHPEVDWRAIAGVGNVLVHDYLLGINLARVWEMVSVHLPVLGSQMEAFRHRSAAIPDA